MAPIAPRIWLKLEEFTEMRQSVAALRNVALTVDQRRSGVFLS